MTTAKLRLQAREYDQAYRELIVRVGEATFRAHPFFGSIPFERVEHEAVVRNVRGPTPLDQEPFTAEGTMTLTPEQIRSFDLSTMAEQMRKSADEILKSARKGYFDHARQVAQATGQMAKDPGPFNFERYLQALEALPPEIIFDSNGNVTAQVVDENGEPPAGYEKVIEYAKSDLKYLLLIQRKKAELDAAKRTRRLPSQYRR